MNRRNCKWEIILYGGCDGINNFVNKYVIAYTDLELYRQFCNSQHRHFWVKIIFPKVIDIGEKSLVKTIFLFLHVSVRLVAVQQLTVETVSEGSVRLQWRQVPGVRGYRVVWGPFTGQDKLYV